MRDLASNLGFDILVDPQTLNQTATSEPVDLFGFNSAVIALVVGGLGSPAPEFSAKLEESDTDDPGDFDDVAASDLIGAFPAELTGAAVHKVGYRGHKRYVRLVLTRTSGDIDVAAVVVKGNAANRPVA